METFLEIQMRAARRDLENIGFFETFPGTGVYLWTRESLQAEQKEWNEEDEAKERDFSIYPYWITTNDGYIEGFGSIEKALAESLREDFREGLVEEKED